jgi:Na+/H+-dicarboxylate symporter
MAARTVAYFLATSLLSALTGLLFTLAIHPGSPKVKATLGAGGPCKHSKTQVT